ncbi:aldose 1-epimerase [Paenibacillus sp. TRM 82003]|nr:aldose 1-epimerase [Paenibacillus sp. TRM 82003]
MTALIESITFLGEPAVKVTTERLEGIVVPGWGSNLISLVWRPTGVSLLRSPTSAEQYAARITLFGMPVLFPPNRLEGGGFTFRGRAYRFPVADPARNIHSHGVLMRTPWALSKAMVEGDGALVETTIASEDAPAVYEAFPHRFTVRQQFRFSADRVDICFQLESRDDAPMPWGLGYHTTMPMPLTADGDLSRCTVRVYADKAWALSERLLPTGELVDHPRREAMAAGLPLDGVKLDDVLLAERGKPVEAVLTDEAAGLQIVYACDDAFKHWVMYNGNTETPSGFFCPEPYTWVTNAPNLDLPYELTGVQVLEPGAVAAARTSLTVRAL